MPAMRKMLHIGIIVILLLLTSCKGHEPVDIPPYIPPVDGDTWEYFEDAGEYFDDLPDEEEPEPEPRYEDIVASITPGFGFDVREKKLENPDTVGWLYIPDTSIDTVILKNPPEAVDNQFYLDVDFNRRPDKSGTFCADFRNEFGFGGREDLSRITTIYGHSFTDDENGGLFAQLKKFRNPEFAFTHPYIFFSTESEDMVWEIFAVFDATVDLPYITPDLADNEFYDMLETVDALSEYSYDSAVGPDDKLLILSTCTYNVRGHSDLPEYNDYRFVVMAKLLNPETVKKSEAVFRVNDEPAAPDLIPVLMGEWKSYSFPVHISGK